MLPQPLPAAQGLTITRAFPFMVQLEREAEVQVESRDISILHFTSDRRDAESRDSLRGP